MPTLFPNLSYRSRLILGICFLVLLTGATATWLAHRSNARSTTLLADQLFREVSSHAVTRTRDFVLRAPPIVESLAKIGSAGLAIDPRDPRDERQGANHSDRLARQFLPILEANPGISWISYGNRNGDFTGVYRTADGKLRVNQSRIVNFKTQLIEHEVNADGTWKVHRRDDDTAYDPRLRPFYMKAAAANRTVWIEPYVFYEQGVPGISCSRAMHDEQGRLMGVLSVDFDLNALSTFMTELSVSKNSRVFLFTSDGTMLAYPGARLEARAGHRTAGKLLTFADFSDPLLDAYRANLKPAATQPAADTFNTFDFTHAGKDYFASASTFRVGDDLVWVFGAVAPKDDFLADFWRSQGLALTVAASAVAIAVFLAIAMARKISRPVLSLTSVMQKVGSGDLSARANLAGSPEFEQLSTALNTMIGDLGDRLRLRHSIQLAMEVQQRLLPPGPPKIPGLDIAGHSTYCDETGGDYYDFLPIHDRRVLLAVGDVTGHGIASALMMSAARAVLRDRANENHLSLGQLMSHLHRVLSIDQSGRNFMTMHLSTIDAATGQFRYASAGHDPALIYDPTNDSFTELTEGGLPLGVLEDGRYDEHSHGPLKPGQIILIGTDGLWEMRNPSGQEFGKPRIRDIIRQNASHPAATIVSSLVMQLAHFRGPTRPTDDVTFIIAKFTGPA